MGIAIVTNNVPRPIIEAFELTRKERQEFDYLDWNAIDNGEDSARFFRYRGTLYDLGEFAWATPLQEFVVGQWDGYLSESFFSGLLVRYVEDDSIVVGRYYS